MSAKRILVSGGIFITILVALLCMSLIWAIYSWEDDFLFLDRDQPYNVATMFTIALMENRSESAKSMVIPSQWARIDQWMVEHQPVSCPAPIGISEEPTWWSTGGGLSDDGSMYELPGLILSLPCPDENDLYRLVVEDISLRYTEKGWLVEDWGQIIEQR